MHLTMKVGPDVPSLRRPEVVERFRALQEIARERGVRTIAHQVMDDHIHWAVLPASAAALRDATRVVLGLLARFLNRLFGRRGPIFVDRYWSVCCKTAKHFWIMLCYVLKNAVTAGFRVRRGRLDPYGAVDEETLGATAFLRAVLGPTPELRRSVVLEMAQGPLPFVPLRERLQPRLPFF